MYIDQLQDYKKTWHKLHQVPDAMMWPNELFLSELLFSLPFTNSEVERMFSALKVIKTERHTSLNTCTLNDLMEINIEGPSFENFSADQAVDFWWADCARRPNQSARKEYSPRATAESSESDSEKDAADFTVDDWDDWFMS